MLLSAKPAFSTRARAQVENTQERKKTHSHPRLQGYLEFDSLHKADSILSELPSSYVSKREAELHGLDIAFCYANPIPVMPHGANGGACVGWWQGGAAWAGGRA